METPDNSDLRCTVCRTVIPFARTVGLTCCPECGTTDIPQRVTDDVEIELYTKELDLISYYAGKHAYVIDKGGDKYQKQVRVILNEINRGLPEYGSLTNFKVSHLTKFKANIHDLHILLVWAENWPRDAGETQNMLKVDKIAQIIEAQLPAEKWKPLTLTRELRDLRENLGGKAGVITLTDSKGEETKF